MKIAIRTDASLKIGTGHVMRCLTLAYELKSRNAEVVFICRDQPGCLIDTIKKNNYKVFKLPTESVENKNEKVNEWLGSSLLFDAEETSKILKEKGEIDWLIVDHYAIDMVWEKKLKSYVNKIMVIDDLADRQHYCDAILDQNYYMDYKTRYLNLLPEHCRVFLGPKYTLIRDEFREQRKKIPNTDFKIKKLFVFFGGVDFYNATQKVLEALVCLEIDGLIVDVVVGAANPNIEALKKICNKVKYINLHVQINNMAELMAEADLGIGAGGTVTWERCCVGLPTIAWPIADNQRQLLENCARFGLVYLPDFSEPTISDIALHIRALMQNMSLCQRMKAKGLEIIDGKGATRIANYLCSPNVKLSIVKQSDMEKIFDWRNAPEVRCFSHNKKEIELIQHKKWFNQVLTDKNRYIFIGSIHDEEIGVLRFDIAGHKAELSIYLRKKMMGKGYGSVFIKAGEEWLKENRPKIKSIIARVLPENTASIGLFKTCGYEMNEIKFQKSTLNDEC